MNRLVVLLPFLFGALLFLSHTPYPGPSLASAPDEAFFPADSAVFAYTPQIKAIIDNKCYECHKTGADDEEAVEELNFDRLPKLDKTDQVYALDDIAESVEKGEMPPEKHLRRHPEDKLTDAEKKALIAWAKDLADKLYE